MSHFKNFKIAYRAANKMAKQQRLELQFKHDLSTAKRAEPPCSPGMRDHQYSHLLDASYGENIEDGIYICSCGEENKLHHFDGKYPFKYIRCRVCNRIFDGECMSTKILTPIVHRADLPTSGLSRTIAEGMCQICPACGLTHRVHLIPGSSVPDYKVECHCGVKSNKFWDIFYICSPKSYRDDPIAASVQLKAEWCSKQTKKALDKRQNKSAPSSYAVQTASTRPNTSATQVPFGSRPAIPSRPYTSVGPAPPFTQPPPIPESEPSLPATPTSPLKRRPAVRGRRITHD